jgi:hypothetical protein
MNDFDTVKELHDSLLSDEFKPSDVSHDSSSCLMCLAEADGAEAEQTETISKGGDMSTYTEEELQAAIAAAVSPLQAELTGIKDSEQTAADEAKIAELNETHEAAIAELQTQLDLSNAEAKAEAKKHDDLVALLEEAAAQEAADEALEARRTEVAASVADTFDDDYVQANLDRWASLDSETFDALVADLKTVKSEVSTKKTTITSTAMSTASEDSNTTNVASLRRELIGQGSEIRALGSRT